MKAKFKDEVLPAVAVLTLVFGMFFMYVFIFLGSFMLDPTPTIHPKAGHVDHNANKIWEGMSKEEYQKIKAEEEQKYAYDFKEPFDTRE